MTYQTFAQAVVLSPFIIMVVGVIVLAVAAIIKQ